MKLTDNFEPLPGIYIFKCLINNKYYIGETKNIQKRMGDHKTQKSQLIHRAFRKHGFENFEIEVRYLPDLDNLARLDLEEELIIEFNSQVPNGYNICPRGQSNLGVPHSNETKAKISQAHKGRKQTPEHVERGRLSRLGKSRSDETKRKISEANRGYNGRTGTKHSEETKIKMSESARGRIASEETKLKMSQLAKERKIGAKPIVQIHPETGQQIKIWDCISDAAEFLGCKSKRTHIVACLKGKYKFAYGFKWEYFHPTTKVYL